MAALAPGITVSRDEQNKNISAGGLPATKINVFIDGTSFKNDVLEGGVHGQDASRGNPFPQIALQEFRVLTQNFKAEYQRAASAVITATTKSGTNNFEVNGFVLGQNKGLVERDPGAVFVCNQRREDDPNATCDPKPEYERLQFGVSAGGPIVRDRAHYFVAVEGNYQNRQSIVTAGRASEFRNVTLPATSQTVGSYEGEFESPFRSTLGVAKLSYVPAENQTLDLSWNGRFETDKRNFGGTTSFESAENVRINYNVLALQHGMTKGDWFNQAHISAPALDLEPDDRKQGAGHRSAEYMGVIRVGAAQHRAEVLCRTASRFATTSRATTCSGSGITCIKRGANVDFLNYEVEKMLDGNPTFYFDVNQSLTAPAWAIWGEVIPGMRARATCSSARTSRTTGTSRTGCSSTSVVRWDAETNMFNNNWVTPDSIRTQLGPIVTAAGYNPGDYFTRGSEDRPMFLGAFQPRIGFSYDVQGNGRTIVHGGFGVYYDREIWNHLIDERSV